MMEHCILQLQTSQSLNRALNLTERREGEGSLVWVHFHYFQLI